MQILNKIVSQTAVLLLLLVMCTVAVIYMNFESIEPSQAFMMLFGGLIVKFVQDVKPSIEEIG